MISCVQKCCVIIFLRSFARCFDVIEARQSRLLKLRWESRWEFGLVARCSMTPDKHLGSTTHHNSRSSFHMICIIALLRCTRFAQSPRRPISQCMWRHRANATHGHSTTLQVVQSCGRPQAGAKTSSPACLRIAASSVARSRVENVSTSSLFLNRWNCGTVCKQHQPL
jgi:hypothetical protein